MKNMIIGLDLSTSTIGISQFTKLGKLNYLSHISPVLKEKSHNSMDDLFRKAIMLKDYLLNESGISLNDLELIVIEEPLIHSKITDVAAKLNQFAGVCYSVLKVQFPKVKIDYISVDNARRFGLPEYVKDGVLFRGVPRKIGKMKISDYKKMLVWGQIAQRYPNATWNLTRNYTLDKKNFDKADAVCVVLGYMAKHDLWEILPLDTNNTLEFIENYFNYLDAQKLLGKFPNKESRMKGLTNLFDEFELNKNLNILLNA
jgi:hypothetical protein